MTHLSLTELWDSGEATPQGDAWDDRHGFQTIGPLIPLVDGASIRASMFGPSQVDRHGRSPNDIPILRQELLIPNFEQNGGRYSETKEKFRQGWSRSQDGGNCYVSSDPKEIEFLGNGCPYGGRTYSPAVILIWPKSNRQAVALQSKGGQEVYNATKPGTKKKT